MYKRLKDIPHKLKLPKLIPVDPPGFKQQSYWVKTITLVIGGGVKPGVLADEETGYPVRVTQIQAQIKFFWRLKQAVRCKENGSDTWIEEFSQIERMIWGAASTNNQEYPCRVTLSIDKVKPGNTDKVIVPKLLHHFSRNAEKRSGLEFEFTISWNPPDESSNTDCTFNSEQIWDDIQDAVRWWSCIGGIGARTRRGAGAIEVYELRKNGRHLLKLISEEDARAAECIWVPCPYQSNNASTCWKNFINRYFGFRNIKKTEKFRLKGKDKEKKTTIWPEKKSYLDSQSMVVQAPKAVLGTPYQIQFKKILKIISNP